MTKQYSIGEAKNALPSIIHHVEEGPSVTITRHGKPVAVLLSVHEYVKLTRKRTGFWPALTEFRKTLKKETVKITDSDFEGLRDVSMGRDIEAYS